MLPKKEEVGKPIALNIKRKQLEAIYTEGDFKVLKKLGYIAYKSSKNKEHKFSKLINILSNENFLLQAMGRISKNKGADSLKHQEWNWHSVIFKSRNLRLWPQKC